MLTRLVVLSLVLITGDIVDAQDQGARLVLESWQAHLSEIRTAEFTLEIEEHLQKGSLDSLANFRGINESIPRQDTAFTNSMRIVFAEPRLFVDTKEMIFDLNEKKYVPRRDRISFDGDITTELNQSSDSSRTQGFLLRGNKDVSSLGLVHFMPLQWFLRLYSWDRSQLAQNISMETKTKSASEMIVFHRPTKEDLLLDVSRGFIPLRFSRKVPGDKKSWQIDVEYRHHAGFGWAPEQWSAVIIVGQSAKHVNCKMTNVKINHEVSTDAFAIQFPIGTKVRDARTTDLQDLIVNDNGELVPEAVYATSKRLSWRTMLSMGIIVFLGVIAVVLWRQKTLPR